jgi:ABC-type nitrate/sulfonate/bicarbonate transport system permease component
VRDQPDMRIPTTIQHWIVPLTVLVGWEALGRAAFLPRYLSVPSVIAAAFWEVTADGELSQAVATSLYRVTVGFAVGSFTGVFVGLSAGLLPSVRNVFDPLVSLFFSVPKIAFLPIVLLLFGLGHTAEISIIGFSCFFPVFIASRHAILSVDKVLIWTAQNMGASRSTMFCRIFLPAAAPRLFSGLRIGLAHSFVVLFATELIGSQTGLGSLILEGEDANRFDLMFAGIATFAALGFLGDRILMAIRRRLLRGQMLGTAEQYMR